MDIHTQVIDGHLLEVCICSVEVVHNVVKENYYWYSRCVNVSIDPLKK